MEPNRKWDDKHTDRLLHYEKSVPNLRLKNLATYLRGGSAIDLACGLGENSLFLANLNYNVKAFDISNVAVNFVNDQAEKLQLNVHARPFDLTEWRNLDIQEHSIDLVVITYYLDRLIFPYVKSIIKNHGYFFMETFYVSPTNKQQKVSDRYKLQPKELLNEFQDWHVLFYEENEKEGRQTIFVRKQDSN